MGLKTQSYELLEAPDRQTSLKLLLQNPDLIILDLGLPDIDGLELLREIRDRNEMVPIIVLSDRDDQTIKAQALDLGAKDYITKPFAMDELLVRAQAALCNQQHAGGGRPMLETERLSVDVVRHTVRIAGREVSLSPREYELLQVLVQHAGKALTPRFLLTELGEEVTNVQCLRVCVQRLRRKIEADPGHPQYLLTETGIGYRLRSSPPG